MMIEKIRKKVLMKAVVQGRWVQHVEDVCKDEEAFRKYLSLVSTIKP